MNYCIVSSEEELFNTITRIAGRVATGKKIEPKKITLKPNDYFNMSSMMISLIKGLKRKKYKTFIENKNGSIKLIITINSRTITFQQSDDYTGSCNGRYEFIICEKFMNKPNNEKPITKNKPQRRKPGWKK